ncbi:MAG: hypothetical protein OEV23_07040, partial [Gallionella sp.]|nr:hypothetical protein [Gallionella sp.]
MAPAIKPPPTRANNEKLALGLRKACQSFFNLLVATGSDIPCFPLGKFFVMDYKFMCASKACFYRSREGG